MAQGDITKEIEYDKIEVASKWNINVRKANVIMEESEGGTKTEISRSFHRHVLVPFVSEYTPAVVAVEAVTGVDASWAHTATDISGEDASVQAIANAAWTDDVKAAYKAMREAQES
tara:strand:- start:45 stop:392 length:348 start_codon:yes stop_codon:yes gene_type:complete